MLDDVSFSRAQSAQKARVAVQPDADSPNIGARFGLECFTLKPSQFSGLCVPSIHIPYLEVSRSIISLTPEETML